MSIKKMIILIISIVCLLIVGYYLSKTFKIATGYVAKYVCSSTYVSNIPLEVVNKSFAFFPINYVKYDINPTERSVKATLWGLFSQTAYFVEKAKYCGCILDKAPPLSMLKWSFDKPNHKDSTDLYWPYGNQLNDSISEDVDQDIIQGVIDSAIQENPSFLAINVAVGDNYLAETYGKGINRNTRLLGWSMTKTITTVLIGALIKEGKISLDDQTGIEAWAHDERKKITIKHLLQMNSGLCWNENYGMISPVTKMLYMTDNMYNNATSYCLESEPGTMWEYSSGTTNILSGIIRKKFDTVDEYLASPNTYLFDKIGMRTAVIEFDHDLNYIMSSYAWATARDWTRFGLLLMNKGEWQGEELYSKEYAQFITSSASGSHDFYGAQIWLNNPTGDAKGLPKERKIFSFPSVPADAYFENGYGGQRVLVIPSRKTVITILSGFESSYDFDNLYKQILSAIKN